MLVESKVFLKHCYRLKEIKPIMLDMLDKITTDLTEIEHLKKINREVYFELSDGGTLLCVKSFPIDHFTSIDGMTDKATFHTPIFAILKQLAH